MKKFTLIALAASALTLAGCATTSNTTTQAGTAATNVGMALFTQAVDTKCRTELNNQQLYKTASLLMTDTQKQSLEDKVCGCVSQKAPQSITLVEMGQAVVDPNARTQIVATAVSKTIQSCVSEFVNKSVAQ